MTVGQMIRTECENGHDLLVERGPEGNVQSAAYKDADGDHWVFAEQSEPKCPVCKAEIIL